MGGLFLRGSHGDAHDREEIHVRAEFVDRGPRLVQVADDIREPFGKAPAGGKPPGDRVVIQAPPRGLFFRLLEARLGFGLVHGEYGVPT